MPQLKVTAHAPKLVKPARAGASRRTVRSSKEKGRARPATRLRLKAKFHGVISAAGPGAARLRAGGPALALGAASTAPPFTECPAVGLDTSCGILLVISASGTTVLGDNTQPPYDGVEDTLIGVVNESSRPVSSLALSSNTDLFGFDGDGLCAVAPGPAGCPFGPTGYEGPNTTFSGITPDTSGGVVNFTQPLAPGDSSYFSLEESLSATQVFSGGPTVSEQGGAGNPSENVTACFAKDPVNCATGQLAEQATDVTIPGRGVPLSLSRTYTAGAATGNGPLGYGWSFSYGMSMAIDPASQDVTITQEDGSTVAFLPNGSGGYIAPPRVLATLVQNPDGSFSFTRKHANVRYDFSPAGQLTGEVDRNGYATTVTYSGNQLATVTDPAGRSLTFTWSGGHITGVTDPLGRSVSYGYDSAGDLTSVTDPAGRKTAFSYDANHLLLTKTDPRGGVTTNTYDSSGRVASQVDPVGLKQTYAYTGDASSPAGGTTTITDGHGNVTSETYANLELLSVTHGAGTPAAATTTYQYDPATLGRTVITDPLGHVTTNTYDSDGNLLSTTDPLGNTTSYGYNGFDEATFKTTPLGQTTSLAYDGQGNLTSVTDALGSTTAYAYGDSSRPGDLTSMTDSDGRVTNMAYDGFGYLASESVTPASGTADTTSYVHNAAGQMVCQASANATASGIACPPAGSPRAAGTTTYTLDADGEVTSVTDALGHTTSYAYDADGNRTAVTDAAGNTTTTSYDGLNRTLSVTDGAGGSSPSTTAHAYDQVLGTGACASGVTGATYCTTVTDPDGHVTIHYIDARDQVIADTRPGGRTAGHAYDLAGDQTGLTDPAGRTTTTAYNADNQVTSVTYSDGTTPDVKYSYDADSQRATMTDGTGTSSYSYDGDGRLASVQDGAGATVSYAYDGAGNITTLTYPSGKTVTRAYDGADRLSSVTDWLGHTTTFSYDADGNQTTASYPNGDDAHAAYNQADRMTGTNLARGATSLASIAYTRDPAGRVARETDTGALTGSTSYTYDDKSKLVGVNSANYGYDPAGQPTTLAGGTKQAFDSAGELTTSTPPAGSPSSPRLDKAVSANETAKGSRITAPKLTTTRKGELVLAFVSADGPASPTQTIKTVTGGRLTWTLASRANHTWGTAEVWQAHAAGAFAAKVTAKLAKAGYDGSITVAAFSGAARTVGATAHAAAKNNHPTVPVTTTKAGSIIWAAGHDWGHSKTRSPDPGQRIIHQFPDKTVHDTFWAEATSNPVPASGTVVKIGASAPAKTRWQLAAVEVLPAAATGPGVATSYSYDANGNRTGVTPAGGQTTKLTYDQANRFTAYGTSVTYGYNGNGMRMFKTVSGTTTAFAYDQSGTVPLLLTGGSDDYVYGPSGLPIEEITGTTATYLHQDQQGSTRLLTDAGGAIIGTYAYNPYGSTVSHTGTASTPLQYDGQYTDAESGYLYLRARYYDPATAQFTSIDPVVGITTDPYGYTADDPVNATDPLGLCAWYNPICDVATATSAIGDVASAAGSTISSTATWVGNHPLQTAGIVLGAISLATGVGEIAGGIAIGGLAIDAGTLALISAGTGAVSTFLDLPDCLKGDTASCVGFGLGGIAGLLSGAEFLPEGWIAEEVTTYLGYGGLGLGSFGYGWDLGNAIRPSRKTASPSC